jgi:hypothetical protein
MGAEVDLAKQFSVRNEPKIAQRCLAYLRPPEICTSKAGKTAMEDACNHYNWSCRTKNS